MEERKKEKKKFNECTLEERQRLSAHKMKEEPKCVPIVLEPRRPTEEGTDKQLQLKRYAIRKEYRVFEMVNTIQNMSKLVGQQKGLFIFTKFPKCKLLGINLTAEEIYEKNKSEDGWLYLLYDTQKPFGGGL